MDLERTGEDVHLTSNAEFFREKQDFSSLIEGCEVLDWHVTFERDGESIAPDGSLITSLIEMNAVFLVATFFSQLKGPNFDSFRNFLIFDGCAAPLHTSEQLASTSEQFASCEKVGLELGSHSSQHQSSGYSKKRALMQYMC